MLSSKIKIFLVSSLYFIVSFYAKLEHDSKEAYLNDVAKSEIIAPRDIPKVNLDSIDIALEMCGIRPNYYTKAPTIDASLEDRAIAYQEKFSQYINVSLGFAAFESWPILCSTLAHEIEGHARQSFMLIILKNILGLEGTKAAEKEAYGIEINEAKRFGLAEEDVAMLKETLNYYYGDVEAEAHHNEIGFLDVILASFRSGEQEENE